ncbi:MAG TPA: PQQ-binding-like beta-propeller repeat protein [Methylomirabilota bacterium]|nr:PQQ-binding-like beta-propeller repeat protein [Methylomirabilota bacterium]
MQNAESKRLLSALCFTAFTILVCHRIEAASAWPQFRGPNCAGISESDKPPIEFGPTTNFLWKTALPAGLSSPCIWEDRIFLTGFVDQKLRTLCVRRGDGKVLWHQFAPAEKIEEVNSDSSPASATPATDGERVYSYFGSYGLLAYNFDGRELWRKPLPLVISLNGSGTSPVVMDGLVIVNRDQEEGKSSLLAVDARTGKTVWETPRPRFNSSYTTPVLWQRGDAKEVVLAGSLQVVGYGLKDGKEQWSANGLEGLSVCPTPVIGEGQLFAASRSMGGMKLPTFASQQKEMDTNGDQKVARDEAKGMMSSKPVFNAIDANKDGFITETEWDASTAMMSKGDWGIFALRAPGTGDVTSTHVAWKKNRGAATVPSPLYYRGRLYLIQDGGRLTCYRAKTGEALYEQERLEADGQYWASPIAANGKIYFASTRGNIAVIEAADTLNVLARNKIVERITATPAIADDKFYVRAANHLWAFGK